MKHPQAQSSSQRPHWLCVAYAFPPINRSGTHRTLGFVKHLDRLGWDATVLSAIARGELWDESLLREVPASTRILRTGWVDASERIKTLYRFRTPQKMRGANVIPCGTDFPVGQKTPEHPRGLKPAARKKRGFREWISRLLITPDSRIGWIGPAVRAGLNAIRCRRPDVIYSTSPYMSAHLIALLLSRHVRLPWIADFRDPWRGNPFRGLGFSSLERWDAFLEWIVLRSATHIVCCTPTMTAQLRRRRPFTESKMTTILNAFDRERFDDIQPMRIAPVDHFVLTHAGQFYGPRSPKVWFAALRRVMDRMPELAGKIHLVLIGSHKFEGRSLFDWAADVGVSDHIRLLGRKTHAETLSCLAGSDALMLAGSSGHGGELQIPNKLFEYLAVRRPIIATCLVASPIVSILDSARAEALVCDPTDEQALAEAITRLVIHRRVDVADTWSGVDQFERAYRAAELAEVFQRVSRRGSLQEGRILKSASMLARITAPDERAPSGTGFVTPEDVIDL